MRHALLAVILLTPFSPTTRADDNIFAYIEEIYASAVERIVQEHKRDDRALAIMFADTDLCEGAIMDKLPWQRLKRLLTAKGIDPAQHLLTRDQVVFQEEDLRFLQKSTDRIVWVHDISGFEWSGSDRIVISHGVCRDKLDFEVEPPPLIFAYRKGKWQLVDEHRNGKGDRGQQTLDVKKRPLLIANLEAIYLAAFLSFVRENDDPDRVYSIALGFDRNRNPLQVPEPFAGRLEARLGTRMRSGFVPAEQVAWREQAMSYYHKPTGKDAWVYSVGPVEWCGADSLHVPVWVGHGNLAGGGVTLVFAKFGRTWRIVRRKDIWVS